MTIHYEVLPEDNILCLRDLCNNLMAFQKSKATIHPEFFDNMSFETRLLPAVKSTKENYIVVAKDNDDIVGYAYSKIAPKHTYSGGFATFIEVGRE